MKMIVSLRNPKDATWAFHNHFYNSLPADSGFDLVHSVRMYFQDYIVIKNMTPVQWTCFLLINSHFLENLEFELYDAANTEKRVRLDGS